MTTISSITSSGSTAGSTAADSTAARIPKQQLGQDDFLKLLATQFQSQDPMKPMEDTAFIAQMAQFSALEQSSTMSKELTALRGDQQRATANSYLGHRVTIDAGKAGTVTGDVTAIDVSGNEPLLVVNGNSYSLSAVLRVEPSVVSAPPANTTVSTGQS